MRSTYTRPVGRHRIAIANLSKVRGRVYEINRINVPSSHRAQGHGSALLQEICTAADQSGVVLRCYCLASGPLDNAALEAWYRRYGFEGESGAMLYRPPKV